jgi:hypothetical protein
MGRAKRLLFFALALAVPPIGAAATNYTVVGWNNLGMHCMDSDYSVFSVLPPYNTINAQLIRGVDGTATILTNGIGITYRSVPDPAGSMNTTSAGKGNFYDYMGSIIGATLPLDWGLPVPNPPGLIYHMPGTANVPQPMTLESGMNWFVAYGIPIFPIDDTGKPNQYPMMRLVATNTLGQTLAANDIVLPVSDEMNCRLCHLSGSGPAARPAAGWVHEPDPGRDYRLNILRLHDERQWTGNAALYAAALASKPFNPAGLYATVTLDKKPFICASCHLSEALPFPQLLGISQLTTAVHKRHAPVVDPRNGLTLDAENNRLSCYTCHPGSVTRCLRGAMGKAVNPADGTMAMQCQSCHGSMSLVGGARTGWLEEPNCQGCHTGNAVNNSGEIRYTSVFTNGVMRNPGVNVPGTNQFATTPNMPGTNLSLYRFSTGHGGVKCSGCHGSTHAEFPSSLPSDNVASEQHQGHAGMLIECDVCHGAMPTSSPTGGPHGMHWLGTSWITRHGSFSGNSGNACKACHGTTLTGTVLSRVQADRSTYTHSFDNGTAIRTFWRGTQVGCFDCHNGPGDGQHDLVTAHPAPTASSSSASTFAGYRVVLAPTVSAGSLRIVSQPANGTVAISNKTVAVYFPSEGFVGTDSFAYAANDGWRDSTLATGTVVVTAQFSLGDAIPDWWRLANFGCTNCPQAAMAADPDADGMNNYQEFLAHTGPNDSRSRLRFFAVQRSGGSSLLTFESLLGSQYGLQYRDSLGVANWAFLTTNVWGRTDSTTLTDSNATGHPQRFYRVIVQP